MKYLYLLRAWGKDFHIFALELQLTYKKWQRIEAQIARENAETD